MSIVRCCRNLSEVSHLIEDLPDFIVMTMDYSHRLMSFSKDSARMLEA